MGIAYTKSQEDLSALSDVESLDDVLEKEKEDLMGYRSPVPGSPPRSPIRSPILRTESVPALNRQRCVFYFVVTCFGCY